MPWSAKAASRRPLTNCCAPNRRCRLRSKTSRRSCRSACSTAPVIASASPTPADHFTPEQMRDYVQCVIRDSARHTAPRDFYLVEGARSWTVSDQLMKKELILQGMGWGHLPRYLIEQELADGKLLSIAGEYFKGGQLE